VPLANIAERAFVENHDFADACALVDVEGLSSPKVCNLLNQLVARMDPGEKYLEIGCYLGLTLLSAAHQNQGKTCIGCDKIRFWSSSTGWGFRVKRAILRNIERHRAGSAQVVFHHMRSQDLFRDGLVPAPIGVYFYDGDHSYAATRYHIVAARPVLSRRSVLVVDDWNDPEIQRGTRDGLREAGLRVLWQRDLAGQNGRSDQWWNGLSVRFIERSA